MNLPFALIIVSLSAIVACNNTNTTIGESQKASPKNVSEKAPNEIYNVKADELTKEFMTWYNYTYYNIHLEQDFIAQDQHANNIDKSSFLNMLMVGNFIAIKTAMQGKVPIYQLYKLSHNEPSIQRTMIQMAQTAIQLSAMEGKELPDYHFSDLDGKIYDRNSTKGKVLVLKCWFIHCVACVKEFPVLNKLVDRYKNRNDIQFISLASDSKEELVSFLNKKTFLYAVVPEMGTYMREELKVDTYPTHLLIDNQGRIVKVSNSIEDLIPFLEKEIGKL